MTLAELKAEYISLRDTAELIRRDYIRTKDMFYCRVVRSVRGKARVLQQYIRQIEKGVLNR